MKKTSLLLCLTLFIGSFSKANLADTTIAKKKYFTQRVKGIINFDGIPNEEAWNAVGWGITDYSFGKPDFNSVWFRSNFVLRWEYERGSELYLVWSQGSTANANNELDTPMFNSLFDNAFSANGRNIFLVKWTYRFLR